jgi:hypothetical protein
VNHGGLGVFDSGSLSLPPEFLDQAFVGREGTMYGIHYEPPQDAKYDTVPRRFDIMLTPIPYRHWPRTARLTIRMHHRPTMIRQISEFLGSQGVAIIQAESTRSGHDTPQQAEHVRYAAFKDAFGNVLELVQPPASREKAVP